MASKYLMNKIENKFLPGVYCSLNALKFQMVSKAMENSFWLHLENGSNSNVVI